jgi:hypothetical protein
MTIHDDLIQNVDLTMVSKKLMDEEEGESWTQELIDLVVPEYRKFLLLTKMHRSEAVVPSKLVDKVCYLKFIAFSF